ncbi:hypothetical protein TNCV_2991551 [Trichonephila clavipes]|uniref:Uncharacterized protein n=1 Tax=Trichonephila clavipes TaxID=2585209 RepID=A0A8X6SHE3_TRICX|nr:hypothetical protein TNCV_2991551 [Trichonephila clavipes]
MYDVEEEELEPDPTDKFAIKECPTNFPKGYLRALTLTRYRKDGGAICRPFWNFTELNRTVTCVVFKAKANDRRTSSQMPR